ncbi:hypothetical protein SNE40_008877 [Patella caerulea]|uniref:Uncharacterized protein n=1 Tax=Patella caerulea TaxID=87958 RepID=A0AAN8PPB8_PATCE
MPKENGKLLHNQSATTSPLLQTPASSKSKSKKTSTQCQPGNYDGQPDFNKTTNCDLLGCDSFVASNVVIDQPGFNIESTVVDNTITANNSNTTCEANNSNITGTSEPSTSFTVVESSQFLPVMMNLNDTMNLMSQHIANLGKNMGIQTHGSSDTVADNIPIRPPPVKKPKLSKKQVRTYNIRLRVKEIFL